MASRFLCIAAFAAAGAHAASVRSSGSTPGGNVLSVTGQGAIDVPTTETVVSASVQKSVSCKDKKPNECSGQPAQSQASAALKEVLDYLKTIDGVSELTTNNIVLQPQYDYSSSKPTLTGYQATSSIEFHVDNDEAGQVLQDILEKGITNLDSVSFVASDEALEKAQNEALKKAVDNAQSQADAVLDAIGATEQGIIGVQIGDASAPAPIPMAAPAPMNEMAASKGVPPPIEAGTQTVQASVTLNIKYE